MAASVVRCLFVPAVRLTVVLYALVLILGDLTVTCSIATLGLIVSLVFFVQFSVSTSDPSRVRLFFGRQRPPLASSSNHNYDHDTNVDDHHQDSPAVNSAKNPTYLIAHRSLALDAPENSLSGINLAAENIFDAVEFDIRFTRDDQLVLFHDDNVSRITEGKSNVADFTLKQIKDLDISTHHLKHHMYRGEKVLTLAEAIASCLQLRLKMFIDVKEPNTRTLGALVSLFQGNFSLYDEAMVVCFSPLFLYQLRKMDPTILTGLVWRPHMLSLHCPTGFLEHSYPTYRESWKRILATVGDFVIDWTYHTLLWYLCGASAVLIHKDMISKEYLRSWKERGVEVLAWPVNDPLEKQYLSNVLRIGYLTDTALPHP